VLDQCGEDVDLADRNELIGRRAATPEPSPSGMVTLHLQLVASPRKAATRRAYNIASVRLRALFVLRREPDVRWVPSMIDSLEVQVLTAAICLEVILPAVPYSRSRVLVGIDLSVANEQGT
jgi:hypothetical protein